jgi:molybdopterin-biosynthesis enzyme MoeA-like protein
LHTLNAERSTPNRGEHQTPNQSKRRTKKPKMPPISALIIGDEILSGKRQDKHLSKVIALLNERGLSLSYARYVGDDPVRITAMLRDSLATGDIVFSFGGIGATPDDHTRQCAAAALGVTLVQHPEAIAAMQAKPDFELTANRRRMAEFPIGATVIPNPFNQIAAFSCGHHHFLPGFPEMSWPMMAWILDTKYANFFHQQVIATETIIIEGAGESNLIDMMERLVTHYPNARLSSLPQFTATGRLIEFSLSGDSIEVPAAMAEAKAEINRLGYIFSVK